MATLGVVLTVATVAIGSIVLAGARVVGTGSAVFGATNMQEGMSEHELAMKGGTGPHRQRIT